MINESPEERRQHYRVSRLSQLLNVVLHDEELLEDPKMFHVCVRYGASVLGLRDEEIADKLAVGAYAVNRWRLGFAAPLPNMRKPVLRHLLKITERRRLGYPVL